MFSTLYTLTNVLYTVLCTFYTLCNVCIMLCTFYTLLYALCVLCCTHFTLCTMVSILYTLLYALCALCTLHYAVPIVQSILCTVCTVHYAVHSYPYSMHCVHLSNIMIKFSSLLHIMIGDIYPKEHSKFLFLNKLQSFFSTELFPGGRAKKRKDNNIVKEDIAVCKSFF